MTTSTAETDLYAPPDRRLYDSRMVKRVLVGIQEMRLRLRQVVDTAVSGTHVVFTRHGRPVAVLVPIGWYRSAAEEMGDPTDIEPYEPAAPTE